MPIVCPFNIFYGWNHFEERFPWGPRLFFNFLAGKGDFTGSHTGGIIKFVLFGWNKRNGILLFENKIMIQSWRLSTTVCIPLVIRRCFVEIICFLRGLVEVSNRNLKLVLLFPLQELKHRLFNFDTLDGTVFWAWHFRSNIVKTVIINTNSFY